MSSPAALPQPIACTPVRLPAFPVPAFPLLALLALVLLVLAPGAGTARAASGEEAAIVDRIEQWFADTRSLKADFLQLDPDGGHATGTVWLRRPGRVRFEYDPPVPLLIVADGVSVIFVDTELEQVDRLPLVRSPLSILTARQVDLRRDTEMRAISREGGVLRLTLADAKSPEEGELTLIFNESPLALRQWVLHDSSGRETKVVLQNVEVNLDLPGRLFVYSDPPARRDRGVP